MRQADADATSMNMYPRALNEIVNFFEQLSEQERRENLIVFAGQAKQFATSEPAAFQLSDVRKDKQCIDHVGIFLRISEGGHVQFAVNLGAKVQTLTRALTAILCRGLNGATTQEVLDLPEDFLPRIVGSELIQRRSQTIYYVLQRMKEAVAKLAVQQAML